MLTSPPPLQDYLGKRIDQICPFSLGKKLTENHCAHFVSHVMEYDGFATTCKNQTSADKLLPAKGAAIRVNNIFNVAPEVGSWADRRLALTSCLIFVTISGNMRRCGNVLSMDEHPLKHIGFYLDGVVWHYGKKDQVEKDPEILFIDKFTRHYMTAGQTVDFFYGRFLK